VNIFIPGEDARMQALKEEALARRHTLTDAMDCDIGILPLPDSRSAYPPLLSIDGKGRTLLHGRLDPSHEDILRRHGWRLKNIQADEDYIRQNAFISAEGALCAAMQRTAFTLRGARCVVVGYGRIAKELTRMLILLGARVRVVARRKSARLKARFRGARAFDMNHMPQAFSDAQVLFNTIPCQIINAQAFERLLPGTLVMELASPPYGFDLSLAKNMGLDAVLESGIPSRYAPKTAAQLLMDHLEAGEQNG